jgi:2-polyprenyl-6-methoxyphenol hydroxylase-like FAD-dependent oxidoreductase
MEQAPDFYFHKIEQIRMSKWSNSRVVCLGDAGYAPTPLTGAGANLAILGAYVLAGELGKLSKGEHPSKALEAYETIFRPFVKETQHIPSIFPGVAHPETTLQRWLFSMVVSAISKVVAIPWLANRSSKVDDEDFKLPHYPMLDDKGTQ